MMVVLSSTIIGTGGRILKAGSYGVGSEQDRLYSRLHSRLEDQHRWQGPFVVRRTRSSLYVVLAMIVLE